MSAISRRGREEVPSRAQHESNDHQLSDESKDGGGCVLMRVSCVPGNVPALQVKVFMYHPHRCSVQWALLLVPEDEKAEGQARTSLRKATSW